MYCSASCNVFFSTLPSNPTKDPSLASVTPAVMAEARFFGVEAFIRGLSARGAAADKSLGRAQAAAQPAAAFADSPSPSAPPLYDFASAAADDGGGDDGLGVDAEPPAYCLAASVSLPAPSSGTNSSSTNSNSNSNNRHSLGSSGSASPCSPGADQLPPPFSAHDLPPEIEERACTPPPAGPLPAAVLAGADVSEGNRVFVLGGDDGEGELPAVEMHNPSTNSFQLVAPMREPRADFGLGVLDELVYAVGGKDGNGSALASVERLLPGCGRWEAVAALPEPRTRMACAAHSDGRLYVVGGRIGTASSASVMRYDPQARRWEAVGPLTTPREGATAVLHRGCLYVIGGYDSERKAYLGSMEVYDNARNSWSLVPGPGLPVARAYAAAVDFKGALLLLGGDGGDGALRLVERFDDQSLRWQQIGSLGCGRAGFGAAVLGDAVLVVGAGSRNAASSEFFLPGSGTSEDGPQMYFERSWHAVCRANPLRSLHADGGGGGALEGLDQFVDLEDQSAC